MRQVGFTNGVQFFGGMGFVTFDKEELSAIIPDYDYGHAFAYLWRRFGPPIDGCDPYKDLTCYCLTTAMDGVYLMCRCYLSAHIAFGIGLSDEIITRMNTPVDGRAHCTREKKDWPQYMQEIWAALLDAVRELKRPINVRDWYINIEGRVKTDDIVNPVEYSPKAGK